MALNFFRQRDIDRMDIHDIPEEFKNYFDTLDDSGKAALLGSRTDLAEALGFVMPETDGPEEAVDSPSLDAASAESEMLTEPVVMTGSVDVDAADSDTIEPVASDEELEDLSQIRRNFYEGKNLDLVLKDNMPELEALAIPDGAKICLLHRTPFEEKQIVFRKDGASYGIKLRVCRECHRVYLEESGMLHIHERLMERKIPHTFYDLDLTNAYLRSQMKPHEFTPEEFLYIPDTWVEEDPRCPIHEEELYEVTCLKKYKDRKITFTAYRCDRCDKFMMRRSAALDLMDRCAESGIPKIETERLVKKAPPKKAILPRSVHSDYLIENGKRSEFHHNVTSMCYELTEEDTVVVSDSVYCAIDGHDSVEEVAALVRVLQKRHGRKAYLFHLGFCPDCQKYYMAREDYQAVYPIGRPEVTILSDLEDEDYQITSGEVFNLERDHLGSVEKQINDEVSSIESNSDYVNQYATGDYDDGNLSFAKYMSKEKYGRRLEELSEYVPKPYSYRVDISLDGLTETYYIGAADIWLDGKQQVISANSDFGHDLINYQTIKIRKGGKDYHIKLTRQFDIDNGSLYGYANLRTDEDIIFDSRVTDPFLVRVLNMRKRQHNLTDIFVTIQENQNRIVNAAFSKNIIVQGCAGSGKTMVLLHRLSSLNYKEKGFDFQENALILTPNDEFTLHIKGVAEELQIGNIQRLSVEQYYIELLLLYSEEFKPGVRISSEMIVRQDFVNYIYSDQFLNDFLAAYSSVIAKRNELSVTLSDLMKAMGQPRRVFNLKENATIVRQMRYALDAMHNLVEIREAEIAAAIEEHRTLVDKKRSLEERSLALEQRSENIMSEILPDVYAKIGTYVSDRQNTISGLQDQLESLHKEQAEIQNRRFPFGRRGRLEDVENRIRPVEQSLNNEIRRQEEELPVLSAPTEGLSEVEILSWLRKVMLIIPEVRENIQVFTDFGEERNKLREELAGTDTLIEAAALKEEEKKASRYSDEIKKAIVYLYSELDKYSLLNIYQLIFDQAVEPFKEAHDIKNIQGKIHRYDLYARLIFALKFFDKAVGTTSFMCIDEGQDLARNEYRLLYKLNQKRVVFNIFGDTNQLMKSGRGISNWSDLHGDYNAELYELKENYRNTNQITRFCNRSFDMKVMQTGVDGVNVREIPRRELEEELAAITDVTERIAILLPRSVQKARYLKQELLPSEISRIIGDRIGNGYISLMYVDEVKGIEFDKVFAASSRMARNEKYIAYTRALSELILVIDEQIADHDSDEMSTVPIENRIKPSISANKKNRESVLNYKPEERVEIGTVASGKAREEQIKSKSEEPESEEKSQAVQKNADPQNVLPGESLYVKVNSEEPDAYKIVTYYGKLKDFTPLKTTEMFIVQFKDNKEMKVAASVAIAERVIFITKERYKRYEDSLSAASELELIR